MGWVCAGRGRVTRDPAREQWSVGRKKIAKGEQRGGRTLIDVESRKQRAAKPGEANRSTEII